MLRSLVRQPCFLVFSWKFNDGISFSPGSCAGTVVAACRDPSSAADLHALGSMAGNEKGKLDVVRMDIEDQASLEAATEHVKSAYGVR